MTDVLVPLGKDPTPSVNGEADVLTPLGRASSGYVYDPDHKLTASPFDVGVASLANDPKARLRYYSQEMGIPESNFRVQGDSIFVRGDDNKYYNVEAGVANQIARGAGPSIPAVTGALSTIAAAPTGPLGMAGFGFAGATAGQGVREALANKLMGQRPSPGRMLNEGLWDLGGTAAGLLIGKGLTKAAATRAGKELNSMLKSGAMNAADALEEVLKKVNLEYGTNIQLTPAEISNSVKLRAQQMAVDNYPEQSQRLADFYQNRAAESGKAYESMLGKEFGPQVSPDIAGGRLSQASEAATARLSQEMNRQGTPLYRSAFDQAEKRGGVNVKHVADKIIELERIMPAAKEELKGLRDMIMRVEVRDTPSGPVDHIVYESNLRLLQDGFKETLDDAISTLVQKGKNKAANKLRDVKTQFLRTVDSQVPAYKEARDKWGELASAKGLAEGGMLPRLAGKELRDFEDMGRLFFSGSSPSEIGRVRNAILKGENGQDVWNAVLRGYLEQQWEKSGRVYKSQLGDPTKAGVVQPLTFWADMIGNTAQKKRLQSAMNTTQWEAFKRLMDVFEATGRASNFNSTTARQQAGQKMLEGSSFAGEAAKTAVNPNPLAILSRAQQGVQNLINEGNVSRIVDVITNGESIKELLKITSQNTNRDKAAMAVLKAFNLARTQAETHIGFDGEQ